MIDLTCEVWWARAAATAASVTIFVCLSLSALSLLRAYSTASAMSLCVSSFILSVEGCGGKSNRFDEVVGDAGEGDLERDMFRISAAGVRKLGDWLVLFLVTARRGLACSRAS